MSEGAVLNEHMIFSVSPKGKYLIIPLHLRLSSVSLLFVHSNVKVAWVQHLADDGIFKPL